MAKTIVLDPGHGIDTPGKRSPGGTLREYEFNGAVAALAQKHLERNGLRVILTRPCTKDANDVSLADRCSIANKAKADLFISIHANAFGATWNPANGYETYVYAKGGEAEKVASTLVKHAAGLGVTIRTPPVKTANFYVLKKTSMPAVLIEHAFMTNQEDCEKLKSQEFREKAAIHIAKGVCTYFGVAWQEELVKPTQCIQEQLSDKPTGQLVLSYNGPMPQLPGAIWYGDGYQGEGLYFRKQEGWVKIA